VEHGIVLPTEYRDALAKHLLAELQKVDIFATVTRPGETAEAGGFPMVTLTAAVGWLTKAAAQDNVVAQRLLGAAYASGTGVGKDQAEAAKWFHRAAEGGDPVAQVELGERYTFGWGVPVDDAEAVRWEVKAAEQGNAVAMVYLGVRHEDGRGVARDPEQSVRYFRQAAELGHIVAMCYLGDMYVTGRGIEQSDREGYRWYLTSAAAGYGKCEPNLEAVGKRLSKAEREAAELDARAWAAAFQARARRRGGTS
jgi:TPR repeat protein